jgi:hypothetical protein
MAARRSGRIRQQLGLRGNRGRRWRRGPFVGSGDLARYHAEQREQVSEWARACQNIELRIGIGLEEIDDPSDLWSVDIAYVTRGLTPEAMAQLSFAQYLGALKTLEAM